jgi:hypothetical protein
VKIPPRPLHPRDHQRIGTVSLSSYSPFSYRCTRILTPVMNYTNDEATEFRKIRIFLRRTLSSSRPQGPDPLGSFWAQKDRGLDSLSSPLGFLCLRLPGHPRPNPLGSGTQVHRCDYAPASTGATFGRTCRVTVPTWMELVPPARFCRFTSVSVRLIVTVPPGASTVLGETLWLWP